MSGTTTRLGIYQMGGGLSGAYGPTEQVNVDKINEGFAKVDAAIGAFICTSTTRPATPFPGQPIYETDSKTVLYFVGGSWVGPVTEAPVTVFGSLWTATTGSGHAPRLHMSNRLVTLVGSMNLNAGASPNNILTVPVAFRPTDASTRFIGSNVTNNGVAFQLAYSGAGVISIPTGYNAAPLAAGSVIPIHASWIQE